MDLSFLQKFADSLALFQKVVVVGVGGRRRDIPWRLVERARCQTLLLVALELPREILLVKRPVYVFPFVDMVAQGTDLLALDFIPILQAIESSIFGYRRCSNLHLDKVFIRRILADCRSMRANFRQRWSIHLGLRNGVSLGSWIKGLQHYTHHCLAAISRHRLGRSLLPYKLSTKRALRASARHTNLCLRKFIKFWGSSLLRAILIHDWRQVVILLLVSLGRICIVDVLFGRVESFPVHQLDLLGLIWCEAWHVDRVLARACPQPGCGDFFVHHLILLILALIFPWVRLVRQLRHVPITSRICVLRALDSLKVLPDRFVLVLIDYRWSNCLQILIRKNIIRLHFVSDWNRFDELTWFHQLNIVVHLIGYLHQLVTASSFLNRGVGGDFARWTSMLLFLLRLQVDPL